MLTMLPPLCLMACTTPVPAIDPEVARDCDQPTLTGQTWNDVAALALRQHDALAECTARMRILRGEP